MHAIKHMLILKNLTIKGFLKHVDKDGFIETFIFQKGKKWDIIKTNPIILILFIHC